METIIGILVLGMLGVTSFSGLGFLISKANEETEE